MNDPQPTPQPAADALVRRPRDLKRRRTILVLASGRRRLLAGLVDALPVLSLSVLLWWWGVGGVEALVPPDDMAFLPEHLAMRYHEGLSTLLKPLTVPFVLGSIWAAICLLLLPNSPGKALFNIAVVDEEGLGAEPSLLWRRVGGYLLSAMCLGFGWVLLLIRGDRRALHDLLSATYVVETGEAAERAKRQR